MTLPIELLQEVALHLIAQTCPQAPLHPPISVTKEMESPYGAVRNVGQLWRASASHPVRRLSQVCSALRTFLLQRMWKVVHIYDKKTLDEIERLFRYLRCVDGTVLASWTQELTYSNYLTNWHESGAPGNISELLFDESGWVGEEDENILQVDAEGFLIVEKDGKLLSDWPVTERFMDEAMYPLPTRADIWALHRFVFQQLVNAERICWRSMIDPGTMFRGSSLMHVIGQLPKLRCFQVDQTYCGGWFYARNLVTLPNIRELYLDCFMLFEGEHADEWSGDPGQPGEPFSLDVDHRNRFLTTSHKLEKLTTTHFCGFDDAKVLAELACIEVTARESLEGHHESHPENLELGRAAARLRPALLALAAPGMLNAQDVRKAASSDPQFACIQSLLEDAADVVARRFNVRNTQQREPESQ